jgi:hypothetical protein
MIREKKVPYRPDWEAVLGPVMDYAETRPEVDKSKIDQGLAYGRRWLPVSN